MRHHAFVSKQDRFWVGICSCSKTWTAKKWTDCFHFTFTHVRSVRRIEAIGGVGFRVVKS